MKQIKSFLIISILLSTSLLAQSADSVKNQTAFSRKHKWALQFQAGYNFQVQAFNGLSFSLKYHLSDKSAFRFGAGYLGDIRNEKEDEYEYCSSNSYNYEYYNYRLNLVFNYIYCVNPYSRFNLYWGIGPTGGYTYNYHKGPSSNNRDLTDTYCRNFWSIGLNGVLGVEWFPIPDFSLFAEYEATGLYSYSHYTQMLVNQQNRYTEKDEGNYKEWSFEANRALLGISVYFDSLF